MKEKKNPAKTEKLNVLSNDKQQQIFHFTKCLNISVFFQNWFRLSCFVGSETVCWNQYKLAVSSKSGFSARKRITWNLLCLWSAVGCVQSSQCCPHDFPFTVCDTRSCWRHRWIELPNWLCRQWGEKREISLRDSLTALSHWLQRDRADTSFLRLSELGFLPSCWAGTG